MKPENPHDQPSIRIRRRDTAAVAGIGGFVLLLFWMFGELGFLETLVATATIAALSIFYYLTVSTTLNPQLRVAQKAEPEPDEAGGVNAQLMLDSLPIPVLLIGSGGRIELANPAAREFLGLGSATGHLSAVLRQPQVLEAVSAALRGQAVDPVEYSLMAPVESHVRAHVAPLRQALDGRPAWQAMLVLSDETSIKRADRMRADFLANASHELRTPLASLAGFIETLRGHAKDDPDARDKFLSIMFDQTERMQRLINDLLSLSRVEMDEHVPPAGEADLVSLVEDVTAFLRPQLQEKSIDLHLDMPEDAPAVGDRDQLTEVVMNLVENAIKYSPAGSGLKISVSESLLRDEAERPSLLLGANASRLTLAAPTSEPGHRYACVRVQDGGPGIERRNLPRLSERFFRVDGQKSGPKEGTGLGLAIVKHIVNRHRGGFTVESAPGEGSVFSVFLPARVDEKNSAEETTG
ncbi:sensor histidine kinase [Maricaulis parjimensis]|uniref:sensor histidine kinase n=1 Tax=Maricaulis parjimensis TaxID=144023 RepID=UPI00193A4AEA|nr:ATP-binding protein [Maricaulis parjimensis]